MYLLQCITAYAAVLSLMRKECGYETAYALVTLKRKLEPHVEFFCGEEMKLVREYAVCGENGEVKLSEDGGFVFRDPSLAPEYARRRAELATVAVNEEFPRITAPKPESILPAHLEALEAFIRFEDGEGRGVRPVPGQSADGGGI